MIEVLVLYYSRSGKTEGLAKSVAEGVSLVPGATASMKRVDYATVNDFISCSAIALGSPNYFGYMAGLMKDFFDKAWGIRDKVIGKPASAFTSGGGSNNSALLSLEKLMAAFKLEKVTEGVVSQGTPIPADLEACKKLGEALAKVAWKSTETPKE